MPTESFKFSEHEWSMENKLRLNSDKCCQMFFRRKVNFPIKIYDNIKLLNYVNILGVTLSDDLKWSRHFDNILMSATRRLYVIRKLKPLLPKVKLMEIFRSFIVSTFMYGTPLFCKLW